MKTNPQRASFLSDRPETRTSEQFWKTRARAGASRPGPPGIRIPAALTIGRWAESGARLIATVDGRPPGYASESLGSGGVGAALGAGRGPPGERALLPKPAQASPDPSIVPSPPTVTCLIPTKFRKADVQ